MDKADKNRIKRQYKEQDFPKGIFRVICKSSKQVWVDSSTDFKSSENRLRAGLKLKNLQARSLAEACETFGADDFIFEIIEEFDTNLSTYELNKALKERREFWKAELGANFVFH